MADWLDVSNITPRIAYTATASQTAFTVPFVFFENEDILVYQNAVLKTLATHYTVTGAEVSTGGTVTLLTGATAGDIILIVRDIAIEQTTHIPPSGPLDIAAMNFQTSKLIAIDQQIDDKLNRSLHFPDNDPTASGELASQAARANKMLAFDSTGAVIYATGPTFVGTTSTGVALVDSRATAQVTTFAISVNVVKTEGLSAPGDGGGKEYIRGLVGDPGVFQDGGGVYWKPASLATAANLTVKSNISGGVAAPSDNTLTAILDAAISSTRGTILYRGASAWSALAPGTAGFTLTAAGAGADPSWVAPGGFLTPEQYGAVGNGSTDDTVALQSFLAAVAGKTGVFTPGKTYMFKGFLIVQSNTYLIGYGATLKALATATSNTGNLWLTDPTQGTALGPANVTIVGLTINGNATARRAGGALATIGNAATFYLISCVNCHLKDCQSIDGEADGFYMGGDSTQGDVCYYCSFENCYATTSSRNAFSFVGTQSCDASNCVASNITYGIAHSNISDGFDCEPNGTTSRNVGLTLTSCKAIGCNEAGFACHGASANNIHVNWVSPYTQGCAVGYLSANVSPNVRIIGARFFSNSTNFSNMAEAISAFP